METESFWDFPACSKRDILKDPRHIDVIIAAILCPETQVEFSGNGIVLYGKESALLVQNASPTTELMLGLIETISSRAKTQLWCRPR